MIANLKSIALGILLGTLLLLIFHFPDYFSQWFSFGSLYIFDYSIKGFDYLMGKDPILILIFVSVVFMWSELKKLRRKLNIINEILETRFDAVDGQVATVKEALETRCNTLEGHIVTVKATVNQINVRNKPPSPPKPSLKIDKPDASPIADDNLSTNQEKEKADYEKLKVEYEKLKIDFEKLKIDFEKLKNVPKVVDAGNATKVQDN